MKRKSTFTLVVALIMLLAFTASCFAATATPAKKPAAKPAAVKPAVKPAAKPAAKPAVKPAVGAAAAGAAAAAAIKAPATLTGDKAKAYVLLAGCKYSGKANSEWKATIFKVPIMGDVDMTVTTAGTGTVSKQTGDGVPKLVGGDFKDRKLNTVPFIEAVAGKGTDIEALLKAAGTVTVAGNTITVTKLTAPNSIMSLLNNVAPGKVTWIKKETTVDLTINVAAGKVTSIKATMNGYCNGSTGKLKGQATGTITY